LKWSRVPLLPFILFKVSGHDCLSCHFFPHRLFLFSKYVFLGLVSEIPHFFGDSAPFCPAGQMDQTPTHSALLRKGCQFPICPNQSPPPPHPPALRRFYAAHLTQVLEHSSFLVISLFFCAPITGSLVLRLQFSSR